jgi:hypothetical protein
MERQLSDSEIEIFVDLWHAERCLWDASSPSYANKDAAKAARKRIGDTLGMNEVYIRAFLFHFNLPIAWLIDVQHCKK